MPKRISPERFDLLSAAENDGGPEVDLPAWFAAAHTGDGSPWLAAAQADELVRYALKRGEGVCLMEAAARMFHEPPRDIGWEILGNDRDGFNWADHRDPKLAYRVFLAKLKKAKLDGVQLLYKLWFAAGA
ncbi:hypothetical protein [Sagittula salina]|uniref:Uncharacterized protein n=1 Tax=Sagittula salina TaxID=2820268 RepID=A0A940MSR0_9RHOB|nr:hypothetical protein [Sagittula salina]MBP0484357.1 hypothetical protein [Sagittula salina]